MLHAVYVNETPGIPYAHAIVEGYKTIETRTRNMLRKLMGERVAIIRTGRHRPAEIIGFVTIDRAEYHTREDLDTDAMRLWQTLIPPGSRYDCTGAGKWCYYLKNPEKLETPILLDTLPIIRKNRSYCVIDA